MSVRLLAITMFFIWFIKLAQKYIFFALYYCVCIFSFDSVYSYDNVWLKMYIKLMTNKPQICHKIYVPECVCVCVLNVGSMSKPTLSNIYTCMQKRAWFRFYLKWLDAHANLIWSIHRNWIIHVTSNRAEFPSLLPSAYGIELRLASFFGIFWTKLNNPQFV